jgi:hypothetical protein
MRTQWHQVLRLAVWSLAWGVATLGSPARTEAGLLKDDLTLTLSDRIRGEFVDWFAPPHDKAPTGAQRYDFLGNQLRVGAKLNAGHVLFTVEVQDTELVNLPNDAGLAAPYGILGPGAIYFANTHQRDQRETFLKQAHVTLSNLPGLGGGSATVGRFEYGDGAETVPSDPALAWVKRSRIAERLVGPFGYTHVTRSIDGARAAYDAAAFNLTALAGRPTQGGFEISANRELDVYLAGLAATLKQIPNFAPFDARLFYLFYEDQRLGAVKTDNRPLAVRRTDADHLSIHTVGAHAITVADAGPGKIDGLLWGAVQTGDWGKLSHDGWAYAAEVGYQLQKVFAAPWVRGGFNASSGDGNSNDRRHATFSQLLPTARIYAQLPFFNLMNNQDLFAQFILKPHSRVTIRSDYHWLRLTTSKDLWYAGGGATSNQFFGFSGTPSSGHRELAYLTDVSATISILKQLTAYAYYGRAFGQRVVKGTFPGGDTANYGYIELTYRY